MVLRCAAHFKRFLVKDEQWAGQNTQYSSNFLIPKAIVALIYHPDRVKIQTF